MRRHDLWGVAEGGGIEPPSPCGGLGLATRHIAALSTFRTRPEIRTQTRRGLNPVPLPVGLGGLVLACFRAGDAWASRLPDFSAVTLTLELVATDLPAFLSPSVGVGLFRHDWYLLWVT